MREVDYIIVGLGLAGAAMAVQAMDAGKRILVIDNQRDNSSSRIAAGLFNPITGRKMVKTWNADNLFAYLHEFYPMVEKRTGKSFFHPFPIYRPFYSVEEQNDWMGKSSDEAYLPYVDRVTCDSIHAAINDPWGGLFLKNCGYLDTKTYINAVKEWIGSVGTLIQGTVSPDSMRIHQGKVEYQNVVANRAIFCTGTLTSFDPWFSKVPVKPLKGETITIDSSFESNFIVNRGVYMVPSSAGKWRVGATYNFGDKEEGPTDGGMDELTTKLRELVKANFTVEAQQWGFRPTTPDRRPLLGVLPEYPELAIFNGLGTKGVSLSPYYSRVLFRCLESEGALSKEVDVNRFNVLYSKESK